MTTDKMKEQNINKIFISYALPTIVSMLIIALQCIIDGIFVSMGVGPQGLAAVNITAPFTSFFFSVAIMIISGGIVICAIAQGKGEQELMKGYTTLTLTILAVTCIALSVTVLTFLKEICYALGCDDILYPYVRDYLSIFALLLFFYVSPCFTEAFARLYQKPNLVFVSGCLSCATNIILDWLLVIELGMGMRGAAIATVTASVVAFAALITQIKFGRIAGTLKDVRRIFFNGSSEMITSVATAISTYVFNIFLMKHTGYIGVAALTIVFYFNMLVNFSTLGMAQALYPLVARNLGARNYDNICKLINTAMKYSFFIGLTAYIFLLFFKEPFIELLSDGNAELAKMTSQAAAFITLAYLVSFVNTIGSSFHTSIEKPLESALISLCKSLIFVLIPLLTLPRLFEASGLDFKTGIWLSIPVGEVLCLAVTIPLMIQSFNKLKAKFVSQ